MLTTINNNVGALDFMGVSQLYRIKIDIVGAFDLWVLTTVNDIIANLEIVGYPDFMGFTQRVFLL